MAFISFLFGAALFVLLVIVLIGTYKTMRGTNGTHNIRRPDGETVSTAMDVDLLIEQGREHNIEMAAQRAASQAKVDKGGAEPAPAVQSGSVPLTVYGAVMPLLYEMAVEHDFRQAQQLVTEANDVARMRAEYEVSQAKQGEELPILEGEVREE